MDINTDNETNSTGRIPNQDHAKEPKLNSSSSMNYEIETFYDSTEEESKDTMSNKASEAEHQQLSYLEYMELPDLEVPE